jgi:hypothetical protein
VNEARVNKPLSVAIDGAYNAEPILSVSLRLTSAMLWRYVQRQAKIFRETDGSGVRSSSLTYSNQVSIMDIYLVATDRSTYRQSIKEP